MQRMSEAGVDLTPEQKMLLQQQLQAEPLEVISLELSDEQTQALRQNGYTEELLSLDLADWEIDNEKIEGIVSDAMERTLVHTAEAIAKDWKERGPQLLSQEVRERSAFRERLDEIWGSPIQLLEMLLAISFEAGATFNDDYRQQAAENNDYVFDALSRLHARGCQVTAEIILLLKNGYADGAHARWRTLHEIAVTAIFISKHGQGTAERFLQHGAVSEYKDATLYEKYHSMLGYRPIEAGVFQDIKSTYEDAIHRHGKSFKGDYGWAVDVLNKDRPTFTDIEENVQLSHLRPFYKLANMNVHAGSIGITFRLGSLPDQDNILLAGPSVFGIAEPGQNTALSIHQLTATLLLITTNMDHLALIRASQILVNEIFREFDDLMELERYPADQN